MSWFAAMLPRHAFSAGEMSLSITFNTNSSRSTDQREHTRRKCDTYSTACALSHPGHLHLRSVTATPFQRSFASARQHMPVRRRQIYLPVIQSSYSSYSSSYDRTCSHDRSIGFAAHAARHRSASHPWIISFGEHPRT